jgi:site-specific recombinase XerD
MGGARALTVAEIKEGIRTLSSSSRYPRRDVALFVLGVNTGYRIAELLSLTIKQVSEFPPIINDHIRISASKMKGGKASRDVKINSMAKKYLAEYLEDWENMFGEGFELKDFLFRSQKRQEIEETGELVQKAISERQAYRIIVSALKDEMKLQGAISTHSMRKTVAKNSNEVLKGNIFKVAKVLGHKSVTSTQSYLGVDQEEVDDTIDKLSEIYESSAKKESGKQEIDEEVKEKPEE